MLQLIVCCIEADDELKFLNLYGTSANSDNYYNIDYLEELIGYKPQDDATKLLELAKAAGRKVREDETIYQGTATVAIEQCDNVVTRNEIMLYESMGIYRCPLILEMLDFQRGYPLMTDIVKAIILGIIEGLTEFYRYRLLDI